MLASYSHSHANQGLPAVDIENASVRGIECVARICSPARMCHPVPASPSNFCENTPVDRENKMARKKRSLTEGKRNSNQRGGAEALGELHDSVCVLLECNPCLPPAHVTRSEA